MIDFIINDDLFLMTTFQTLLTIPKGRQLKIDLQAVKSVQIRISAILLFLKVS